MKIYFEHVGKEKYLGAWLDYQSEIPNIGDFVMLSADMHENKEKYKVVKRIFLEDYVKLCVINTDGYI